MLCLDYEDEALEEICFELVSFLNEYQDCNGNPDVCLNNELILKESNNTQCIIRKFNSGNPNTTSTDHMYNGSESDLPALIRTFINHQSNNQ